MFSLKSGYNPLLMQNQPLQTDTERDNGRWGSPIYNTL